VIRGESVDAIALFPKVRDALAIVKPDTIVGWHRADTPSGHADTMPELLSEGRARHAGQPLQSLEGPAMGRISVHGAHGRADLAIGQGEEPSDATIGRCCEVKSQRLHQHDMGGRSVGTALRNQ
jgi:hypothetical protein